MKTQYQIEKTNINMRIVNDFNLKKQAEDLGVSIWKTPSFLLLMLGLVTIIAMTVVYFISGEYDNSPEILIIAESIVVSVILVFGNSLIQQIEVIARVNKQKTEFVSVASHQLRTPLGAIRWETELLLSKLGSSLDVKQKERIANINMLAVRMTRLVNDLLDVTRIDQGRMILKKEEVDLEKIVSEIYENFISLAKAKNLHVIVNKKGKINHISSDNERLKLVVENLLSNSIKYTKNNGKIEMEFFEEKGSVVFNLKDNGVGIPKEQQEQVFNKFFRSDNVVKYQTEGTGLGLYIAKNIIEKSGGKMWFRSKEHIGSIFSFSLPVYKS